MDFKELGQLLRQQREQQGLTLEDVYQKTKISPSSLENIEQAALDDLPHPVYVKGFIKNYAHFLGLDSEQLSQEFARNLALHEETEEDTAENDLAFPEHKEQSRFWVLISVVVGIVLLTVLGYLLYDLFLRDPAQAPSQLESRQKVQEKLVTEQGPEGFEESEPGHSPEIIEGESEKIIEFEPLELVQKNDETEVGPEQDAISRDAEPEQEVPEQEDEVIQEAAEVEEDAPVLQADPELEEPDKAQHLEISATEACWLRAIVDNETEEMYLRPGESVSFKFWEQLQLRLGNAGGVKLFFNEEEFPFEAKSGEVLELNFP